MRAIKAVKKIGKKRTVFCTGGVCGSQYFEWKLGETYTYEGELVLNKSGFHFYKEEDFVFGLSGMDTCFIEVEVLGEIKQDTEKAVTNKLKVIRYIPKKEWKNKIDNKSNSGDWNSGFFNSGNRNSGDRNSGDRNSGYRNSGFFNSGFFNSGYRNSGDRNSGDWNSGNNNSGDWNSGDRNSGYRNSGNNNSGDWNSGNWNSGNWNSGNWNSGDWNSGNRNTGKWNSGNKNSGFFNRDTPKTIRVFEKEIDIFIWDNTEKPEFLYFDLQEGKTYKECFVDSWNNTTEEDRKKVLDLPGFDWEIFTEISGIEKPEDWED